MIRHIRQVRTSPRRQYRSDIGNADRLLHHAHFVQIRGDSYRDKRKSGILGQQIPVMQTEE